MSAVWTKFKMWTRIIVFGAAAIYVLIFIVLNRDKTVDLHFVFKEYKQISVLILLLITSISSIVGWWLFKAIFLTMRQMRDINRLAELDRAQKIERDNLIKAQKLQTKPEAEIVVEKKE